MPALPSVPKVVRVTVKQTLQEDTDVLNRFFIQYTGTAPTSTDLNTFCGATSAAWGTHMSPEQNTNISVTEVLAEDLSSPSGAVGTSSLAQPGTRSGVTLTAAVCFVLKLTIARRYRGGHPRTYLWVGSETDIATVQSWKATFAAEVEAAWVAFISELASSVWTGGGSIQQVNVSYYAGFHNFTFPSGRTRPIPTLRSTPVVDVVSAISGNLHIGSQRRRNKQSA
jgi:hypothetical protein